MYIGTLFFWIYVHETAVPTLIWKWRKPHQSFSKMLEMARNSGPGMPCGLGLGALYAVDAQDAAPPSSGPRVPEELLGSRAVFEELYLGSIMGETTSDSIGSTTIQLLVGSKHLGENPIPLVNHHQCPHYMMVTFGIKVRHVQSHPNGSSCSYFSLYHHYINLHCIVSHHFSTISPSYRHCITIFPRHIMSQGFIIVRLVSIFDLVSHYIA